MNWRGLELKDSVIIHKLPKGPEGHEEVKKLLHVFTFDGAGA